MGVRLPKINQIILIIIVAEFVLVTAFGFLSPIFAVFVTEQIRNGTVKVVGFALTIYWVTKSIIQLFVARYLDKNHGEVDDFYFLITGALLNALWVSLYYFAQETWHVYTLHFMVGISDAMLVPPFYGIFTRHIDKGQEGFEWSLYSSFSLGAGSALGGALGGILAAAAGFRIIFPIVGLLTFISAIMLIFLRPYIIPRHTRLPEPPKDHFRLPIERKKM